MVENSDLIKKALEVYNYNQLTNDVKVSEVSAALLTESGKIYTGVSINASCGIGFCAEHSAISEMAKEGDFIIKKAVAVTEGGKVVPPCGRCRELMIQISNKNLEAEIIVSNEKTVKLSDLIPNRWQDSFYEQ